MASNAEEAPVPGARSPSAAGGGAGAPPAGLGERVAAQLRAIVAVSRALTRVDDERQLLTLIAAAACECLRFRFCMVAERAEDGNFYVRATSGTAVPEDPDFRLQDYVLKGDVYRRLESVATRRGSVLWVPGDHPVHSDPVVGGSVVRTVPSAPKGAWHPAALIVAPFIDADGRVVGFLSPDDPTDGELPTDAELAVLETLAHLSVVALEVVRARSAERARQQLADTQRRQLEGLLVAGTAVRGNFALDEVLDEVARTMTSVAGFRRVAIYLTEEDGETLKVHATAGLPADDDRRLRERPVTLTSFAPLMQPAMRVSRSYLFDQRYFTLPEELRDSLSIPGGSGGWMPGMWHPVDSLTIPIDDAGGRRIGLISVDEPANGRFPSRDHVQALEFFADHCSVAVEQARRHEELAHLAATDSMTGLANRRAFTDAARQMLSRLQAEGTDATVMFCDLDRFKLINDRFGHHWGDKVLAAFARVLRDRLRAGDLVSRYGGEEFVALLPSLSGTAAWQLAEEIRRRTAAIGWEPGERGPAVSVSIGTATTAGCGWSLDELLRRADQALYRAKQAGRDRVVSG